MARVDQLREEAIAAYNAVIALKDDSGDVSAENEERLAGLVTDWKAKDTAWKKAQSSSDALTDMERLGEYHQQATGRALPFQRTVIDPQRASSYGEQFIASDEYRALVESGALRDGSKSAFRTPPVALRPLAAASDVIQTGTGGPAVAFDRPTYLPTQGLPQRPLTVRDLFGQGTTETDLVKYAQQTGFDSGAAAVAQAATINTNTLAGGLKPQSSVGWDEAESRATTIATYMVATRQSLADIGQLRGLIDNQGTLMIQLEEEDQIISGNGTAPNLSGIYDQTIQTLDVTAATSDGDVNLDAIRNAIRLVKTGVSRANPDAVVVNPLDSMYFDLIVDNEGRYRTGDPFGNGPDVAPIWRRRRVESEAIAEGSALVGAFRVGATVLERSPIAIYTADQHSDFFIRNLIVILFEERIALPVYFPTAFVDVTLHAWS